jgi:hypothetical protein
MLLGIILASLAAWFYSVHGRSFSKRSKLASNLPAQALITIQINYVVKSSLALSLGLVGALSIVRFRTAIKEPEELIYLFMAIAIGVGLGADQRLPTVLAMAIILGYLLVRAYTRPRPLRSNLFLNISLQHEGGKPTSEAHGKPQGISVEHPVEGSVEHPVEGSVEHPVEGSVEHPVEGAPVGDDQTMEPGRSQAFAQINKILKEGVEAADLRRLDQSAAGLQAMYLISAKDDQALSDLMDNLYEALPGCEISFVEQDNLLGA